MSSPPTARHLDVNTAARTGALWVTASTVATSAANYAFSLVLIHVLTPAGYSSYAAVQSLLLILGSGCMAAIPWALAHHVATDPTPGAARQAMGFGLVAASLQGIGFAAAAFAIVVPTAGLPLAWAAATAAFSLSLITAPLGVLQGRQQLRTIAALRVLETVVRLGVAGLLLAIVRRDPTLVVIGFTVGSLTLFVAAAVTTRWALPPRWSAPATSRSLLRRSVRLGVVQLALASIGVVDTIAVTFTSLSVPDTAAYQIAALLGRIPLYLGTAVALAYFPALSKLDHEHQAGPVLAAATRLMALVGVSVAALVATCPPVLLGFVTADHASQVRTLLPATAVCGATVATATVVLTGVQARGRYRTAMALVIPLALAQPLLLVATGHTGSVLAFAVAAATLGTAALVVAMAGSRAWRPWSQITRADLSWLAAATAAAVLAYLVPWAWPLVAGACLVLVRRATTG